MEIRAHVNLQKSEALVMTVEAIKLFDNPAKRFIIEADLGGFSGIEKRKNGYYDINYSNTTHQFIKERKISKKEAIALIESTLISRREEY